MRVDFYVLAEDAPNARALCACRLAEQAIEQGQRVYVQTSSREAAMRLDDMLWTFNDRSFLPHEIYGGASDAHPRVMILLGEGPPPQSHRQVLINLTDAIPAVLDNIERVLEIVETDAEKKRAARERFKAYRERGCTLETHNL